MTTGLALAPEHLPDGTRVLVVTGEIDMNNAAELREALVSQLKAGECLVIDLTGVTYIDSAGISVLFAHVDTIRVVAGPLLDRVLTVSGLPELTTVDIRAT